MMKDPRRIELIKACGFGLVAGLAYYAFMSVTGITIPCLFYEITGFKCPGCGVTHMLVHLIRLEFKEAFESNPLLFFMLPFLLVLLIIRITFMPKWLDPNSKILSRIMLVCVVLSLVFGIVRNIS
ncbi:MAG: DUF2752 domain-containing protein [Ruminococcus sp.]|nr:DUF2752 domain-containing protein [Ruminococcus sp.]